jgi:hypothetical protein
VNSPWGFGSDFRSPKSQRRTLTKKCVPSPERCIPENRGLHLESLLAGVAYSRLQLFQKRSQPTSPEVSYFTSNAPPIRAMCASSGISLGYQSNSIMCKHGSPTPLLCEIRQSIYRDNCAAKNKLSALAETRLDSLHIHTEMYRRIL